MSLLKKTIFLGALVTGNLLAAESDPEAVELLRKSESLMRSDATLAEYQVDIVRPDWQRHMTFRSHDDMRDNRFRMEILSPRKTRGTVFLKVDNTLSMYLPKLERRINISPAMMQDPWMGSDFNNQDLLETDSLIDHYTHRITNREEKDGAVIYTIESTPLPTATVTWRKLIHQVRGDGLPLSLEYHCDRKVSRRMVFDQVREVSGRTIPTRWTMTPLDDAGKRTVITLTAIEFDTNVDDALFNPGGKGARSGP
jgi:outer membrane lipoprotein-sorting protein